MISRVKVFAVSLVALTVVNAPVAFGQEINVCIAQFPCHLNTGKLLPGFKKGTPCKWELICEKYRKSRQFKKLQDKLARQKRQTLKISQS